MYKLACISFSLSLLLFMPSMKKADNSFKSEQKKFSRVKNAYAKKEATLKLDFASKKLNYDGFKMILVGYKAEKELKVYIKTKNAQTFTLFKTYDFCVLSGNLGPKRMEGDAQVPEGLYEISHFNPASNFHLSLKVNYPNASDKLLSDPNKPGGDIFIHGACVSVGCIPITDDLIQELYILAVECRNNGFTIPVYLFPCRMTETKLELLEKTGLYKPFESFWKNLKTMYNAFQKNKTALKYHVDQKGQYILD